MSGMHRQPKSPISISTIVVLIALAIVVMALITSILNGGKSGNHHSSASPSASSASTSSSARTLPIQVQPIQKSAEAKAQRGTTSTATRGSAVSPRVKVAHSASPTLIYVVRHGDNLTVISKWFHGRGYSPVYKWNRKTIGKDPNLIHPGQHLIVVPGSRTQKVVNHL